MRVLLIAIFALAVNAHSQQPTPSPAAETAVITPAIKTFQLDSKLMTRPIPYTVILPVNYETEKDARFPVIYLLHGLGGDHKITKLSSAKYTDRQRVKRKAQSWGRRYRALPPGERLAVLAAIMAAEAHERL